MNGKCGVAETYLRSFVTACLAVLVLAGCSEAAIGLKAHAPAPAKHEALVPVRVTATQPSKLDGLIAKYAAMYDVPESLIRRVIVRESGYNAKARNGPYYGLMQISYATAISMGYHGPASGLLDADTNLRYAVKYLAGAYIVGGNNADQAVRYYASGYYYDAKRMGLLDEVGL